MTEISIHPDVKEPVIFSGPTQAAKAGLDRIKLQGRLVDAEVRIKEKPVVIKQQALSLEPIAGATVLTHDGLEIANIDLEAEPAELTNKPSVPLTVVVEAMDHRGDVWFRHYDFRVDPAGITTATVVDLNGREVSALAEQAVTGVDITDHWPTPRAAYAPEWSQLIRNLGSEYLQPVPVDAQ